MLLLKINGYLKNALDEEYGCSAVRNSAMTFCLDLHHKPYIFWGGGKWARMAVGLPFPYRSRCMGGHQSHIPCCWQHLTALAGIARFCLLQHTNTSSYTIFVHLLAVTVSPPVLQAPHCSHCRPRTSESFLFSFTVLHTKGK